MIDKQQLLTVTRWVITEDDDYGDYGWGGDGGGSGGANLYTTFIQPFIDVVDTAAAVAETALSKTQLLVNVATYGILDMLVPWVKPQYEAMMQHDKQRMSAIMQRHASTFARTEQALTEVGGDYDGAGVFFALFPGAVIAKNLARVTAGGSTPAAKITVDSVFDFLDAVTFGVTGNVTDALRRKLNISENILREDDGDEHTSSMNLAAKVFVAPKIQTLLRQSKTLIELRNDAIKALSAMLRDAIVPIRKLKKVETLQQLEGITGRKFNLKDAAKQHADNNNITSIDKHAIDAVIDDVLPTLVEQAAQPFVARLQHLKSDLVTLAKLYGVSDDDQMKQLNELFEQAFAELKS